MATITPAAPCRVTCAGDGGPWLAATLVMLLAWKVYCGSSRRMVLMNRMPEISFVSVIKMISGCCIVIASRTVSHEVRMPRQFRVIMCRLSAFPRCMGVCSLADVATRVVSITGLEGARSSSKVSWEWGRLCVPAGIVVMGCRHGGAGTFSESVGDGFILVMNASIGPV